MKDDRQQNSIIDYLLPLLNASDGGESCTDDSAETRAAKRIRTFIDEIPGGFLIYCADGDEKIIYANNALIEIFRCDGFADFMALTGGKFGGIVHHDDLARVEKDIQDQISKNADKLDYVEYRIVRKDGIVRWVEDYGHYITDSSGGNYFYVFISDATEKITRQIAEKATLINDRKIREKKLQNIIEEYDKERKLIRQEHLQRLEVIEGLSVNYSSIIYADIKKNIALPYRLSTRLVSQFTKKLEVRELRWFLDDYVNVWVHPDDRDFVKKQTSIGFIQSVLAEKNTYYINYRCVQNDETQYIQLRIVNVSGDGKPNQIVLGYRNIDEEVLQEMRQKQLLEAALQNAKAADNAKTTFLSNMSHDMRTPLNAIFGYVKLARKAETPDSPVLKYLKKIEIAGNQILDLVDKVLELSYAESRDDTVVEAPFNVIEALEQEIKRISAQAEDKDIKLSLNTKAVANPKVIGDKDKLMQIIANILDNALKYNKHGGKVDVTVTQKTGLLNKISTFIFDVNDNGIGISQQMLNRIFDPFIRENNTTESGVYGAGLGLTICRQLAETMNATITATSTLGKGSTFTVTIGLKPDLPESREPQHNSQIDLSGKKILIVEDNEINLEIETELLEDLGCIVDSAENGQIAIEKIRTAGDRHTEYDLVLMDIQMPVMDGRAAARGIRALKDNPLSQVPIIALSANVFESDRRASLEAGMDAHINKPLDVNMLIQTIQAALNRSDK